jgi:hypothetical protein
MGIRRLPSKLMIRTKRFDRLFMAFGWIRDLFLSCIGARTFFFAKSFVLFKPNQDQA